MTKGINDNYQELNNQTRTSQEGFTLLNLLLQNFRTDTDTSNLLELALKKICEINGWQYGEIWKVEHFSNAIICTGTFAEDIPGIKNFSEKSSSSIFRSGEGFIGKVWAGRHIIWENNLNHEKENLRLSWIKEAGLKSIIAAPVFSGGEVKAVLSFYSIENEERDEAKFQLLKAAADHLGNFLEFRNTEEKLQKSERILVDTQKLTHTGSWEWDIISNRIYWTRELFNIYGIEPREALDYETVLNFLLAEDREIFNFSIKKAFENRNPFRFEHKIIRPNGEIRVLSQLGEVLSDHHGNITKLIGTVHDITSLIKTEERLKKSEEYFRSLIENTLDIKSILNKEGNFLYISPAIENTLGYKTSDLIGKNIIKYIHPADISRIFRVFVNILKTPDKIVSIEFRVKDKNNKWRSFESIMKNLIENPSVCGIVVNSRDITLRTDAENTIRTLLNVSKRLNSTLNVDHLMDVLVEEAIKLTDAEGGFSGLKTSEGMVCKKFFLKDESTDFEYSWSEESIDLPGKQLKSKGSIIINDMKEDNGNLFGEIKKRFRVNSAILVLIQNSQSEVIGFFAVTNKLSSGTFPELDRDKLTALSQSASTAIQNAMAYQKIQAAEFQLKNSREQLRRLSAHTQSAREEERTRISREIHDELGQALTGLKMDLSWLEKKLKEGPQLSTAIQEKIAAMFGLINSTIKSIRKISSELRPGVLDYLGLPAAIEWQAQEFQSRTGIECRILNIPKELNLDQDFSTALFRIFQETLTNVARHAQATLIEINLILQKRNIILQIHDNGKGITQEEIINSKSFGILGMRERTFLLGGEFTISGIPNGGTTVTVTIPTGKLKDKGANP